MCSVHVCYEIRKLPIHLFLTNYYFTFISITQESNTINCCAAHMSDKDALQADVVVRKVIH